MCAPSEGGGGDLKAGEWCRDSMSWESPEEVPPSPAGASSSEQEGLKEKH